MNTQVTDNENSSSTSSARVDANRRNAQLSTGPRTEEGKARVSQNATRSGWFSRDLRVSEGKIELYLEFEQAWQQELAPTGLAELETFSYSAQLLISKSARAKTALPFRSSAGLGSANSKKPGDLNIESDSEKFIFHRLVSDGRNET